MVDQRKNGRIRPPMSLNKLNWESNMNPVNQSEDNFLKQGAELEN